MGTHVSCHAGGRLIDITLETALARIAERDSLLLASDYDGTIAPIAPDPASAPPHPETLEAFLRLARLPRVHAVVVSGRSPIMLATLFGDHDDVMLVGNHGASIGTSEESARVEQLVAALGDVAVRYPGTVVEPKPTGASFHYRHADDPKGASDAARAVVTGSGTKVIEGKMIVEAVVGSGDKGTAITALRKQFGVDGVVFVGDDVTDEAAFETLETAPNGYDVGVKVGDGPTAAAYSVPDVPAVARVFEQLNRFLTHT